MAEVIRMPLLSDTMTEGKIVAWNKKVGDKVKADDVLADVETDKATMEVNGYVDGTLLYIGVPEGEAAKINQIIAIVGKEGEDYKGLLDEEGAVSSEQPAVGKEQPATGKEQVEESKPETTEGVELQGKFEPIQERANNKALPNNLKSGIEKLSGYSTDDVKVHYNSAQPAQLNAKGYAQGTDIHVAPGQERHLPHEVWHVVQQKQGRVKPTMQIKEEIPVNDNAGLEKEADKLGAKAMGLKFVPKK